MAVNNIQFTKIELKITTYLFKHCRNRYNARQLARILHINHAHANKLCNALVGKGLLVKDEIGNSAYFSYDYSDKLAIHFMEYLLSLETKDFPPWLSILSYTLKRFKDHIEMGLVFGSSIAGSNFNDIDILLMYDPKQAKVIQKIKDEIRKTGLVEKPLRYMDIAKKDILLNKDDTIFYSVLAECIVFHNPEKYVEVVKKCRK